MGYQFHLSRSAAFVSLIFATFAAAGCAQLDNVDVRTTTMNLSISEADNKSTLLNLARSSLSEPITFAGLSGFDGHQGYTAGIQMPNLTVINGNVTQYTTPGNMAGLSASTDFHYLASNDNATYSALLQPIDPATIGYFIRQEYPRELLFFLVVSQIRVTKQGVSRDYLNNGVSAEEIDLYPEGHTPFEEFGTLLQSLIDSGLTAQVDVTTARRSKLCFDRQIKPIYIDSPEVVPGSYRPTCAEAMPILSFGKDEKITKLPPFASSYKFSDLKSGTSIEISLRSTFGVYRYLGRLISKRVNLRVLRDPAERDRSIITVVDNSNDCFVGELYRGRIYCVPNRATTSKRVFSFLHDIVKLYTVQTDKPTTITARLIQ